MGRDRPRCSRLGAGRNAGRVGVGLAGRWADPARVLARRQPLRGRAAPRRRRRARRRALRSRPGLRRGHLRRAGPDPRAHRDDRRRRRPQGVADPPRAPPRAPRRPRLGRTAGRGAWTVGCAGARRSLRPPRDPRGRSGDVRRSTLAPCAAGCPYPSAGTRGAARASSCSRSGAGSDSTGRFTSSVRSTSSGRGAWAGVGSRCGVACLVGRAGTGAEGRGLACRCCRDRAESHIASSALDGVGRRQGEAKPRHRPVSEACTRTGHRRRELRAGVGRGTAARHEVAVTGLVREIVRRRTGGRIFTHCWCFPGRRRSPNEVRHESHDGAHGRTRVRSRRTSRESRRIASPGRDRGARRSYDHRRGRPRRRASRPKATPYHSRP